MDALFGNAVVEELLGDLREAGASGDDDDGLASQRAFLSDPASELQTTLSYCTAIAWLMYQRAGGKVDTPISSEMATA